MQSCIINIIISEKHLVKSFEENSTIVVDLQLVKIEKMSTVCGFIMSHPFKNS